ncbi:polysialyltransferase family glycosyltransferase [Aeribacillus pallidus]|jgi:hypothetical protein|uniref:polysialyltransferase family glycosyltransferase n=1 Tax=Aeribacillus TaxID=1055323 RepID=UPI0007B46B1C|nr:MULTISPECIES: polysialyltransferase family glycosyltransferase [Aeribacillus]KZM55124.1 hypothetical protein A3Q35_12585 [Aeribacillus pallidus]MED0650947.1 polysialyltransferase family glycosyltransferase [Aeribacillus composti]MED4488516.1 polysialyltransferase family glycosyltransferase [Aeribacillus pallidus]
MNLVVLHSPYHLFLYRRFLTKKFIEKEKTILLIYPYQNIDLNVFEDDAAFIQYAKANKLLNRFNYKIMFLNFLSFFTENLRINKSNTELFERIFKANKINALYVFTDNLPFYVKLIKTAKKYKVENRYLVEDGLIHYVDMSVQKKVDYVFKSIIKIFLGYGRQLFRGYGSNKLITKHFCLNPKLSRFNVETIPLIQEPLSIESTSLEKNKEIIYISQTLSEFNYLSLEEEIGIIKKLYHIALEKGYKFYIKPHPRENLKKFDGLPKELIINDDSIAELLAIDRGAIAISPISSAIFNLVNIYGYKDAYYIFDALNLRSVNLKILTSKFPKENRIVDLDEFFNLI